jgi:hypothetical protein
LLKGEDLTANVDGAAVLMPVSGLSVLSIGFTGSFLSTNLLSGFSGFFVNIDIGTPPTLRHPPPRTGRHAYLCS